MNLVRIRGCEFSKGTALSVLARSCRTARLSVDAIVTYEPAGLAAALLPGRAGQVPKWDKRRAVGVGSDLLTGLSLALQQRWEGAQQGCGGVWALGMSPSLAGA